MIVAGSHRLGEGGLCKGIMGVWLLLFSSLQNGKQRNGAEAVTVKDLLPMAHFLTSEFPGPRGPMLPRIARSNSGVGRRHFRIHP